MLAAIRAQVPFRINGREVTVGKGLTTVMLHGKIIATISFSKRIITLNGRTPVSRKSARVFNTILREHTSYSIQSINGQWVLAGLSNGPEPVGKREIVLPFAKVLREAARVESVEKGTYLK